MSENEGANFRTARQNEAACAEDAARGVSSGIFGWRENVGQIRPQIEKPLDDGGSVPGTATNHAKCQACGNFIAEAGNPPALRQSDWAASERAKRVPLYKG